MSLAQELTTQRWDSDDASTPACPIMVMGTLGAGKSTLLNAFVGRDLLPTDTAVPFRIDHCAEGRDFRSRAALGDEISVWENATLEGLSKWNQTGHCTFVEVQGELSFGPNPTPRVALYDTPGTNYAPDRRRAERTCRAPGTG